MNRKIRKLVALMAGVTVCGVVAEQAQAISLNFGNTPGGQISFDGANHFDFLPGGVAGGGNNSFRITGSSGGATTIGDFGTMTGPAGGWTFSPITGTVTGAGTLDIEDTFGAHLTASLSFIKLDVNGPGTGGQFNQSLGLSLTGILYSGIDPDLAALATAGTAIETLSFTFPTLGHSLSNLGSVAQKTSFSGSLISVTPPAPDGGATMALLGFALLTVEGLRRKLS